MQLSFNHLSVPVRDLDAAEQLFTGVFGFQRSDRKADAILTLADPDGFTLVLSTIPAARGEVVAYPEMFHLGFFVEDRAAVHSAHERLGGHGIQLEMSPRVMRERYGFYARVLDGLLLEVSAPRTDQ